MSVDLQLQTDVEAKAQQLFEIARPAFHYARKGTPDAHLFEQSLQGTLLLNAMRRVAAHLLEQPL